MKKTTAILFCIFCVQLSFAQIKTRTELRRIINTARVDTVILEALWELSDDYLTDFLDSTRYFAEKGYQLARQTNHSDWQARFQFTLGKMYKQQGNYPNAIDWYLQAKNTWARIGDKVGEASAVFPFQTTYSW